MFNLQAKKSKELKLIVEKQLEYLVDIHWRANDKWTKDYVILKHPISFSKEV